MLKLKVHVLMELVSISSLLLLYLLTMVYLKKKTKQNTYAQVCGKLQVASFTEKTEGLKRTIVSELLRKRCKNCPKK